MEGHNRIGKQEVLIQLSLSHSQEEVMRPKELIAEAISLPVEERAILVDSIFRSLNSPEEDIDSQWVVEAERRLEEVRAGRVEPIPCDDVFARICNRFPGWTTLYHRDGQDMNRLTSMLHE